MHTYDESEKLNAWVCFLIVFPFIFIKHRNYLVEQKKTNMVRLKKFHEYCFPASENIVSIKSFQSKDNWLDDIEIKLVFFSPKSACLNKLKCPTAQVINWFCVCSFLALKLIYPRKGKNKRDKWFASYKCSMSISVAVKMLVQQWVESQWMMMDIYWCACCMNLLQKISIQIRIYAFLTIHHYILLLEIDEMTMMAKSCFYERTRQEENEFFVHE